MWSFVSFIIGLVAGWYGRESLEEAWGRLQKWRWNRRKNLLQERAPAWLVEYYGHSAVPDALYALPQDPNYTLPYLTNEAWYGDAVRDTRIVLTTETCPVKTNHWVIRNRQWLGQRIRDDSILRFIRIRQDENETQIEAGKCKYFQYLSTCGRLEDELYRCLVSEKRKIGIGFRRPRLRDEVAYSFGALASGSLGAQIIGFGVAVVCVHEKKLKILVQERSDENAVAGGTHALVPCFVWNPDTVDGVKLDPMLHHLLLEFYEELYDMEDLNRVDESGHVDREWFYDDEPIKTLITLHKSGKLDFEVLGFGFDGLTGEFNVAALAHIKDKNFYERERKKMKSNWEVKKVQALALDSEELRAIFWSNRLYPVARFCLSRVFQRFKIVCPKPV